MTTAKEHYAAALKLLWSTFLPNWKWLLANPKTKRCIIQ